MELALEMLNITKTFTNVVANDDVSLYVEQSEIHGLIGENGAGKSTLMNILYGMQRPDDGVIKLFGKETHIESPSKAIQLGISMVHQHFMLMPNISVLRNIILGKPPKKMGIIDEKASKDRIKEIMELYNLPVDLDAKVYQLSVGEKQRVEIIKALYRDAKIIILDEPTAVLTPKETDKLMEVLKKLKEQGKSVIFITHKLREVMAITDKITVMRKGVVTGRRDKASTNGDELSTLMVGREVNLTIPRGEYNPTDVVLEVQKLSALNQRGLPAVREVSFNVKKGEVVGIAGVEGNGQTELIESITGMLSPTGGRVFFEGKDITSIGVRKSREMGMSHVPEDRLKFGTAKTCTIRDNLILNRYYREPYSKFTIMDNGKLAQFSEKLKDEFMIKVPDTTFKLSTLSGGNMQKVVFAREMETNPTLLIAAQPTRGVDIGAIEYIHKKIIETRDNGKSVLLISAELDEIISLSDRILIMYEGEIVAELNREDLDENVIGNYMMGVKRQGGEAHEE